VTSKTHIYYRSHRRTVKAVYGTPPSWTNYGTPLPRHGSRTGRKDATCKLRAHGPENSAEVWLTGASLSFLYEIAKANVTQAGSQMQANTASIS